MRYTLAVASTLAAGRFLSAEAPAPGSNATVPLVHNVNLHAATDSDEVEAVLRDDQSPTDLVDSVSAVASAANAQGDAARSVTDGVVFALGDGGSDYKAAFQGAVAPKPAITKSMVILDSWIEQRSKIAFETAYEESLMRKKAREAIESELTGQKPALTLKLNTEGKNEARRIASGASKKAAGVVAVKAYQVTRDLLKEKAFDTCKAISTVKSFPAQCQVEALKEFTPALQQARTSWANAAARNAASSVESEATKAADYATSGVTKQDVPPVAYAAARQVIDAELPKLKQQYRAEMLKQLKAMVGARGRFWKRKASDIERKVLSAVTQAVKDSPVKAGEAAIDRTAASRAKELSSAYIAQYMAPKFSAAAHVALTKGVRSAFKKVMGKYEPRWDAPR
mmetsp:Transcript_15325/g.38778  ORF Transcript_15325/g.38778 Transcript_15325/m.38778 type:complete len:397 (-) Transcript_15325:111-1301(-)